MSESIVTELVDGGQRLNIAITGKFNFNLFKEFSAAYKDLQPEPKLYVIDLSGVSHVDSAALGMMLLLRDRASRVEGAVKLANPNDDVQKIFDMAHFESLFEITH